MSNPDEEFEFINTSIIKKYNEDIFTIDRATMLNGKDIIYKLINDNQNSMEKIYNFIIECLNNFLYEIENKFNSSNEEDVIKNLLDETNRYKKYVFYLNKLF